jgi:type II secretory pathway pseudopilin PulG
MGATATLSATSLVVEGGQEVTCSVEVRNSGAVVDQFVIEVVGEPGNWARAEPAMINLLPGEAAAVTVRFAPPRSADVPAGPAPFGIRVSSQEDPAGSVVEEGVIDVAPFADLTAEVVPPKVESSSTAKYRVAVDNRGNYPVAIRLAAADPEGELDFRFKRKEIVLEPDSTAFVRLLARPRDRFLRGQPVRHRFEVTVTPAEREPITVEATLVQRQILPKWLVPVLIAVLVLALILAALWWTVLRPAVRSAAGDAAARQAAEVKQSAQEAKDQAGQAKADAGQAKTDAGQAKQNNDQTRQEVGLPPAANQPPTNGGGGSQPGGTGPGTAPVPRLTGNPTDFRIAADAPIDANTRRFRDFTYSPPPNKTVSITDAILQNPRGDIGTLRMGRGTPSGVTILTEYGLGNFRDLDEHWVQPIVLRPGERLVVSVSCQNPPEKGNCTPSVFFTARIEG